MNEDEPNLLKILDETEALRRSRQKELNTIGWPREVLEDTYGIVYSTEELRERYEVVGFVRLVVVKSRADGSLGSFEFQHSPRFYFNHIKDGDL